MKNKPWIINLERRAEEQKRRKFHREEIKTKLDVKLEKYLKHLNHRWPKRVQPQDSQGSTRKRRRKKRTEDDIRTS